LADSITKMKFMFKDTDRFLFICPCILQTVLSILPRLEHSGTLWCQTVTEFSGVDMQPHL